MHRFVDVMVDGPVGHQACSMAEVSGPPPQHCVELVTDLGPRIMVAPNQKLIGLSRGSPDTFLGRTCAQTQVGQQWTCDAALRRAPVARLASRQSSPSRSSTGALSHSLISPSTCRSTTRRATAVPPHAPVGGTEDFVPSTRNIEVMWLLGRLIPDHKTIADFRKDNGAAIRKVRAQFDGRRRRTTRRPVTLASTRYMGWSARDRR